MKHWKQGCDPLDYMPYQYGTSKLTFRGPKRELGQEYALFIGGAETFGKFVARPFPALIEDQTGMQSVNFGGVNAGIDSFRKDLDVLAVAANADYVVVQAMGAQFQSNRYFTVHPRRNDRFIRAQPRLITQFPNVDFATISYVGHLIETLWRENPAMTRVIIRDLQLRWHVRMRQFLQAIDRPSVVLNLTGTSDGWGQAGRNLISPQMLTALETDQVKTLTLSGTHNETMASRQVFLAKEVNEAQYLPDAFGHQRIATEIVEILRCRTILD